MTERGWGLVYVRGGMVGAGTEGGIIRIGGRSRAVSKSEGFERSVRRAEIGGSVMLGLLEFFAGGMEGIVECVDL